MIRMNRVVFGLAALATTSCREAPKTPPAPVVVTQADRDEAKTVYSSRCIACHGADGAAGIGGARNLTDPEWHKQRSDARIEMVLRYGGASMGLLPTMPANPDLGNRPAVLAALREYVRGLSR